MSTPIINVSMRKGTGTNKSIQTRKSGNLPGVVYSRGEEPKPIAMDAKEVEKLISRHGQSLKIALDLEGVRTFVVIKETQRNTMKNELVHIDFQTLDENEKIKMIMPIHIINREEVETSIQFIQVNINEIEIQTFPKHLPDKIELDAMKLKEKDVLTIADLDIAENEEIEILQDRENVVASLTYINRKVEDEEEEEA